MSRIAGALVLLCLVAAPAFAERPRDVMVWENVPNAPPVGATVPYNTIFLNRCANGCTIRPGSTDSRTDTSSLVNQQRTLTKFPYTDQVWADVVACVKDTFQPFNIVITDVDPGSANHFEIMVAGSPADVGMSSGIGGVSPFQCNSAYIPNSLVYDFAAVWQGNVEDICSTAAQEIAHSFTLDHVTVAADPMTYFPYNGRRYFQNTAAQCGSDCVSGQGPFGQTCSGQNHSCACTGAQTQNSVTTLTNLFGQGTLTPPTVTITKPKLGDNVSPGFPVTATAVDDSGIVTMAELRVDNQLVLTLTSQPFAFNAPATLSNGTHHVEVTAYDPHGAPGKGTVDVVIGPPCTKPADCSNMTDTCIGGRCVPGPGVQGGLGTVCNLGTDCASGQCANDGTNMYCVDACLKGQCPDGFGCQPTGAADGTGVCWPGYDDGSGGCSAGTGGPITLGLAFAALVFGRRRRR